MTVTVQVDATWRLSQAQFNLTLGPTPNVMGTNEYVLQDAQGIPSGLFIKEDVTYGIMQAPMISRTIDANLLAETVAIDGVTISFKTLIDATSKFFDKWRLEDGTKVTPTG